MGDVPLALVRVFVEDLESIRRVSGHDVRGILGMDFLRRYVVEIDPDCGKLRLLDKAPATAGVTAPIEFANGSAYVVGRIDGVYRKRLFVDTGYCSAASVGLSPKVFDKLLALSGKKYEHGTTHLTAASGDRDGGRIVRVESISVGNAAVRDIDIDEVGADVLGLTFFSRFQTIFDFPNGALYLVPGRHSAVPDRRDRSGLHIWRISDRILVHSVDARSPAANATINEGDELVQINGQNAAKLNLNKIRLMLRAENVALPIILKRGEETLTVVLRQ